MCPAAAVGSTKKSKSKKVSKKKATTKKVSSKAKEDPVIEEPAEEQTKRAGATSAKVAIGPDAPTHADRSENIAHSDSSLSSMAKSMNKDPNYLTIKLSKTLKSRLVFKAQSEGLSTDEFCEELLAEGIVLRAWEIMERKVTMKQDSSGNGNNRSNNNFKGNHFNKNKGQNNSNRRNNNSNHNSRSKQHNANFNNNKMMDDKATFMEYLRKQETK